MISIAIATPHFNTDAPYELPTAREDPGSGAFLCKIPAQQRSDQRLDPTAYAELSLPP